MATQSCDTRPRIEFRNRVPICLCVKCGSEICPAAYNISVGRFTDVLSTDLPILCKECLVKD